DLERAPALEDDVDLVVLVRGLAVGLRRDEHKDADLETGRAGGDLVNAGGRRQPPLGPLDIERAGRPHAPARSTPPLAATDARRGRLRPGGARTPRARRRSPRHGPPGRERGTFRRSCPAAARAARVRSVPEPRGGRARPGRTPVDPRSGSALSESAGRAQA